MFQDKVMFRNTAKKYTNLGRTSIKQPLAGTPSEQLKIFIATNTTSQKNLSIYKNLARGVTMSYLDPPPRLVPSLFRVGKNIKLIIGEFQ